MRTAKDEQILQTIGNNVRENRIRLNMTQLDLANQAMIHRNYISNIENGKMNPTILLLLNIADALNIDIIDILILQ